MASKPGSKPEWKDDVSGCLDVIKSVFSWSNRVDDIKTDEIIDPINIKIFNIIGDGGQAYVYRAKWRNREVAVKIFKDDNEVDLVELRKLLKLKHNNVISLKGIVEKFDSKQLHHPLYGPGLIMEFCKLSLNDIIHDRTTAISSGKVLDWGREIVAGMQYLHKKQIIHRDVKSPNILMGYDNRLKISDLDSHTCGSADSDATISFRGTPNWMAPELIRSEKCSGKVDVWSFGVVIWELLTRHEPYKTLNSNQVIFGVGGGKLKLPIPSSCPPQIAALLEMCWKSEPHLRPSFHQIKNVIMLAEMEMRNISIVKLEEDRCKWRREINTALDDYKTAKAVSTEVRKEEGLKEVNKLRDKMETMWKSKIAGGELSPQYIHREFSRLPGSLRGPIVRAAADVPGSPILRSADYSRSSTRSNNRTRRVRSRRKSSIFTTQNGFHADDNDSDREDSSEDNSRLKRSESRLKSVSFHNIRKRSQKASSSSDDGNISSASPRSSACEDESEFESDFFSSADEQTADKSEVTNDQTPDNTRYDRSLSIDEGFASRCASERKIAAQKTAMIGRITYDQSSNI